MKVEYNGAWMRRNPGLRIDTYDIAGLVNEVTKSCRMKIGINGFSCTGIYPLHKDVFSDFDFLPSQVIDVPEVSDGVRPTEQPDEQTILIQPTTSTGEATVNGSPTTSEAIVNRSPTTSATVVLKQISPIPDASHRWLGCRKVILVKQTFLPVVLSRILWK